MKIFTQFRIKLLPTLIIATLASPLTLMAQGHCGTDEVFSARAKKDTSLIRKRNEAFIRVRNTPVQAANKTSTVRVIPVVFHVIHQYGSENIPKERILTEIDSLNKCYRGHNADTSKVRPQFKHLIADCNIEFRLAKLDPNGNCTDGIDRIYSPLTTDAGENVKSLSQWDQTKYFNIWVVASINSSSVPPGEYILGYSTLPYTYPDPLPASDGVIIRADQVGVGSKTLVHEAGHYFGLFHPFQGGCGSSTSCDFSSVSSGGDGMCDTPPTSDNNFNCGEMDHACNGDTPMTENYMDYSKCSFLFTKDQASQVDYVLNNIRQSLWSSSNLSSTGVDGSYNPVYCAPVADFYSSDSLTCSNKNVQFFSTSYNGPVTTYYWSFQGGNPSTSSDSSPVVTYPNPGTYGVYLIARNQEGYTIKTKNNLIKVLSDSNKLISPYFEGFETADPSTATWSFPVNAGTTGNIGFKSTSLAANKGSNSVYLQNRKGAAGNTYSFTLPPVDISKLTSYSLTFSYAFAKCILSDSDKFQVQVSQDCGETYQNIVIHPRGTFTTTTRLVPIYTDFVPDSTEWKQASSNFQGFSSNKELYFKFSVTNGGGNNVYIDNINIGNYSRSGIDNNTEASNNVEVYPNPVSSQITINVNASQSAQATVSVFDMAGRKLAEMKNLDINPGGAEFNFSTGQLNISNTGMYYLRVNIGSSVVVKKIIVVK